jgi:hypothetical protein
MHVNEISMKRAYIYNKEAKGVSMREDSKSKEKNSVKKIRTAMNRKPLNQIDNEFYNYIMELINTAKEYSIPERNEIVTDLAEYYRKQSGGYAMPNAMLTALADFILDDELSNNSNSKSRKNAYPILSFRQLQRRGTNEFSLETEKIDYFQNKKNYNIAEKKRIIEKSENN